MNHTLQTVVQIEEKSKSEPKDIGDASVPQGSILGGILFVLYQNDFPENFTEDESDSIQYADDDTDKVRDAKLEELEKMIQAKVNASTAWIRDKLRERKFQEFGRKLRIKVEDKIVEESQNEKLLGIVINNNLCWSTHLYGNNLQGTEKIEGLLPHLSKRTGMLKEVAPLMKRSQLNSVIEGVFNAKLIYGIQLFCNTWGIVPMDETSRKYSAFKKDDLRRLQVLQNVTLRLQTKLNKYTPTDQLLNTSDALSVHQLGALHTITNHHDLQGTPLRKTKPSGRANETKK